MILDSEIITPDLREQMEEARMEGLGFRCDRSPHKPTKKDDGSYSGGTKFERDDLAAHVSNAPRCYTLVQSYQVQRNLAGPTASAKVTMDRKPSPHLLSREKIVKVRPTDLLERSSDLSSASLLLRWPLQH